MKFLRATILLLLATAPAVTAQDPGWRLTTDQVKAITGRASAGRNLQPRAWPDGARVAVLLSFDVDNQTPALGGAQDARSVSIGALSRGEYGARIGLQRVVDVLDKHSIPASFFIPAVSLQLNPEMTSVIKKSGHHEFAVHGWIHEQNSVLPRDVEKDLILRARDELARLTGSRPVGYRAPSWNFSPNTLGILRELGFLYDSSLMADDRPYELLENGQPTGIVELPVEWILDDAPLVDPQGQRYSTPRDLLQVYIDEFDKAWEERGMFILTTHPHIIGHRSRIIVIEKLIEHIKSKGGAWFATHQQAATHVKKESLDNDHGRR
ncbi:MAG: polysaccharide deacetylase [Gemmatimonadota bacterium]